MKKINIQSLPVYWRIKEKRQKKDKLIPSNFNYRFDELKEVGLLIEKRSQKLLKFLSEIYKKESNIGFLQEGHSMAKGYSGDFFNFLNKNINKKEIRNILEIGCGACFILKKLLKKGYKVTGLDPSPIAAKEARRVGVKVFKGFYPSKKINSLFDLIFHIDVLEHVPNPTNFLLEKKKNLRDNGYIIIKVPDCTESIKSGDISFITHQHVNNFTENSLKSLVEFCGYKIISFEKSKFGSSLYCLAKKTNFAKKKKKNTSAENKKFFFKVKKPLKRFENIILKLKNKNKTIGFYVPLRSFPYITFIKKLNQFRLFDDTQHYRNNYFDGCDVKIENFNDLVKKPVDHLFIMSFPFGKKLKSKVFKYIPSQKITLLSEIVR